MVKVFYIKDFLQLELNERYAPDFHDPSRPRMDNNLIHTDLALKHRMKKDIGEKGKVSFTEGAKMFAPFVDVVPTKDALNYLGYTAVQVRLLLSNLERNKNPIILLGFGGLNNGLMYWLIKMAEFVEMDVIRQLRIYVVDGDDVEIHNLARWHFFSQSDERNKALWLRAHNKKTREIGYVVAYPKMLTEALLANIKERHEEETGNPCMPIVIGGPDSGTRPILTASPNCNFIFTGQYMQHLNMWINPIYTSKSVDSYGGIWANAFPLFTLKVALTFLSNLPKLAKKDKKVLETKLLTMNFSAFINRNDTDNSVGIIPLNHTWTFVDGYRRKR